MSCLSDERDLSEELVKEGFALDWPQYLQVDKTKYETSGVRQKEKRADQPK